ncbi:MAG: hypothetical protein CMH49_06405 [Myxococcales bacterium]|nr:hypothetical protein [Myxococcales bacterium]
MIGEVLLLRSQRGLRFTAELGIQNHCYSAYELLIHHLSTLCPHEAQWWSRAKAYTNEPISPSMWGLMKVAGKRLYFVTQQELEDLWSTIEHDQTTTFSPNHLADDYCQAVGKLNSAEKTLKLDFKQELVKFTDYQQAITWLETKCMLYHKLLEQNQNHRNQSQQNHRNQSQQNQSHKGPESIEDLKPRRRWYGTRRVVAALALDQNLRLIAIRFNQPELGHSAHAERRLLEYIWQKQLNLDSNKITLISSLKPCKMCAGLWISHCPHQDLEIIYLHDDPGPNGQNTAFDQGSHAYKEASKWRKPLKSFRQRHWLINPASR